MSAAFVRNSASAPLDHTTGVDLKISLLKVCRHCFKSSFLPHTVVDAETFAVENRDGSFVGIVYITLAVVVTTG